MTPGSGATILNTWFQRLRIAHTPVTFTYSGAR